MHGPMAGRQRVEPVNIRLSHDFEVCTPVTRSRAPFIFNGTSLIVAHRGASKERTFDGKTFLKSLNGEAKSFKKN